MAIAGVTIISLEWCMLVLTLVFVVLRLYARSSTRQRRRFPWGLSDVFVVLGWASFAAQASMDTVLFHLGLFRPGVKQFSPEASTASFRDVETALKIYYTENVTYLNCMYCVKAAMLCLFHEFFPRFMRKTWLALVITDVFVGATFLTGALMNIFYCFPISRNWTTDTKEYCSSFDQPIVLGFVVGSHIFTDLMIYFLPFIVIRTLTLPHWQKVGIGITFALGFLCVFFACALVVATYVNSTFGLYYTFAIFEQTWALVVVCVPSIRTILIRMGLWKEGTLTGTGHSRELDVFTVSSERTGPRKLHRHRRVSLDDDFTESALAGCSADTINDGTGVLEHAAV